MDLSRLRTGERIAAGAAVLLFIDMFLHWYGVNADAVGGKAVVAAAEGAGFATTANAWRAFGILDIYLLIVILVALGMAFLSATQRSVALPVAASVITTVLAGLATFIVFLRLVDQPGGWVPGAPSDRYIDLRFWAWVGFFLTAGVAYGGWRSMRDEGTNLQDARLQAERAIRGDRVPTRPAPPPEPLGTPGEQDAPPSTAP
jgi:hypothetical protein